MQPDEPAPPTQAEIEKQFAETVELFKVALQEWVSLGMPDAQIGQAFGLALSEWRRTAPERVEAEGGPTEDGQPMSDVLRRLREEAREAGLPVAEPGLDADDDPLRPMLDPSWVFGRGVRPGG